MYGMNDNVDGYWGQWDSGFGPLHGRQIGRQPGLLVPPTPYSAPRPFSRSQPLLPSPPLPLFTATERNPSLYYDFNVLAPARPPLLTISCAVQSIRADLRWSAPRVNKTMNFIYRMKITGGSKGEMISEYPQWKTSVTINLEPGTYYNVTIEAVAGTRVLAAGELPFKSILCTAEIALLQNRAINFLQNIANSNQMQEIFLFYRNKPQDYWRKIMETDGVMRPYLKDANGNPGCPINNEIDGLFFSARLHQGMLPVSSPFGGQRLKIMCQKLFMPETHHLYFCDFYCNTTVHYVTLVICLPNTPVDIFCSKTLLRLDPFNNLYMQITPDPVYNYRYFVNNQIWVEMYYTANVPLCWGEFDYTVSLGQSKPNGVPNNKFCKTCNLYPLESDENDVANNRKRSLTLENDDTSETGNNKRPKTDLVFVDVPAKISLTNDEHSTFLLSMDKIKETEESKQFDLIKPYVVDVVCYLVDETVKICGEIVVENNTVDNNTVPTIKVCTSSNEENNSSSTSFRLTEEGSKFLNDLEQKTSSSSSLTFQLEQSSAENDGSVSLAEVKLKADEFDSKTKKLFETLNQIKASMRLLDKRLAAYR